MMDFRGASAESLAALTDELKSQLSGDSAARAGDSLYDVALLLREQAAVRRVATDTTVPSEARSGLVRDLLAGKVDDAALGLVATAAGRRWTHGGDLPDALERLAEVAQVVSAAPHADRVADELFALGRVLADNTDLRAALADPMRSVGDKEELLDTLLRGKTLPATVALAKQGVGGSYGPLGSALSAYRALAADLHGEDVATVYVARPLTDDQEGRLTAALAKQYGRKVHANVVLDPHVLGGVRVEIGDDVIDGTIMARLDDARRRMAG